MTAAIGQERCTEKTKFAAIKSSFRSFYFYFQVKGVCFFLLNTTEMLYKLYSSESVPSPSSSVNVTMKILIELRTLFLGLLVEKRWLILLSYPNHAKLKPFAEQRQYIKPARNSQAPGIEPATIRSDVIGLPVQN